MEQKRKALWVDDDLHAAIRIKAIENRMSVRDYLRSLMNLKPGIYETEQQNTSSESSFHRVDGSVPEARLE